jgi:hypothetical protein
MTQNTLPTEAKSREVQRIQGDLRFVGSPHGVTMIPGTWVRARDFDRELAARVLAERERDEARPQK